MWKSETTKLHNPFRYAGEYFDEETGFVYLRNRYYDSSIGRFISEDPIRDGLNWYAYCSNNPINFIDPWGLEEAKDKDVLSTEDYNEVLAFTAVYDWAKENNDTLLMEKAHLECVRIRQKTEYSGIEGYGPPRTNPINTKGVYFNTFISGYIDKYNYTNKTHYTNTYNRTEFVDEKVKINVSVYDEFDAEWDSGRWIGNLSETGGFGDFANNIIFPAYDYYNSKTNPKVTLRGGDIKLNITRKNEKNQITNM